MDIAIVAATRSPIGRFGGALAPLSAVQIGTQVLKNLIQQVIAGTSQADAVIENMVDEVIIGQVLSAGCGQNPARQTSMHAGLNVTTPAYTINHVCGSGLKAVQLAYQAIQCGDAQFVIAGGQESMSQAAHVLPNARQGQRLGDWSLVDTLVHDGLTDAFHHYHMGITAENMAKQFSINRAQQDEFAAASQAKAIAAIESLRMRNEMTPIKVVNRKQTTTFVQDEQPRAHVTTDTLGQLKPAFQKSGTVTVGNASTLNDGAAMVALSSVEKAKALGLPIMGIIKSVANVGVEPSVMGTGPINASKKAVEKAGWTMDKLELIEANEAFAVQALSVCQALAWDSDIVNVNGGAVALGHPIGASGCRILVSLLHEMQRRDVHKGLATLCIGGGMGIAMCIER